VVGLRACPPCNTNTIDRTLAVSIGQRSSIQGAGSVMSCAPSGSVLQSPDWIVTGKVTAPALSTDLHRQPLDHMVQPYPEAEVASVGISQ
jgi:hypothetical protein